MNNTYLYKPKSWTTVLFLVTIAAALALHLGKKSVLLYVGISAEHNHEISLHISNFSISYILSLVVGYVWLLYGAPLKRVFLFITIIVIVNFAYELFLPLLNTLDITDAYYGTVGSMFSAMVLLLIKQKGLKLTSSVEKK